MLRKLYDTMSLKRLFNTRAPGQIATFLVLIMVAVLIFILTTVNMGTVTIKTVGLTNAADAAGLYLASMLGTRAQQYLSVLPDNEPEYCQHVSWWDTILAVVVAIIVVIATCGAGATTLPGLSGKASRQLSESRKCFCRTC